MPAVQEEPVGILYNHQQTALDNPVFDMHLKQTRSADSAEVEIRGGQNREGTKHLADFLLQPPTDSLTRARG